VNKSEANDVVQEWHAALNEGDADRLVALSTEDVEVGGPRGTGRGAALLRDWVARASIHLAPLQILTRDGAVVVEQSARWRGDDGQLGEPKKVATLFRLRDGKVASVIRFPDVDSAVAASAQRGSHAGG